MQHPSPMSTAILQISPSQVLYNSNLRDHKGNPFISRNTNFSDRKTLHKHWVEAVCLVSFVCEPVGSIHVIFESFHLSSYLSFYSYLSIRHRFSERQLLQGFSHFRTVVFGQLFQLLSLPFLFLNHKVFIGFVLWLTLRIFFFVLKFVPFFNTCNLTAFRPNI